MTEHKGYRIVPINNMIGYTLQHVGRGSIHKSLQGMFTSKGEAIKAINYYKGKEVDNGETDSAIGVEQVQRGPDHRRKSSKQS